MKIKKALYTLSIVSIIFTACKKEEDTPVAINGCTDTTATNYDELATVDDGSCIYGIVGVWTPTSLVIDSSQTVTINGETVYEIDGELLTFSGSQTMTAEEADLGGNMEFTNDGKFYEDGYEMDYTYSNNVLTITTDDTTMVLPCSVTSTNLSVTIEESIDTAWVEPGFGDITVSAYYGQTINCSRNTAVNTNVNQRVRNTNHSWFVKPKLDNSRIINKLKE